MKRQTFILVTVMSLGLLSVQAQQDSAKRYQKVEQLLATMKLPEAYTGSIDESVEQQVAAHPILANYRGEIKSLFVKWIGWPEMKNGVAAIYLKYFSVEELDALIKFYRTPAGQKLALHNVDLMKETQHLAQRMLQPHVAEWSKFVTEREYSPAVDSVVTHVNK